MRDLTEQEKRAVGEALRGPFWRIFKEFAEEKKLEWVEQAEQGLTADMTSILTREQLLGASKHTKFLLVDFINYVKTQNQNHNPDYHE